MRYALNLDGLQRARPEGNYRPPFTTARAATLHRSMGLDVDGVRLASLIQQGRLPEVDREGRNRRWTKHDVDLAAVLLYEMEYWTPQTHFLHYENIDPQSYLTAVRNVESRGGRTQDKTMILSPANPAIGEMRSVRYE